MEEKVLRTVLGDIPISGVGFILPHEHLFTDLRGPSALNYAQSPIKSVMKTVLPHLSAAEAAGVTALVECSTIGVGRNIEILRHLANNTKIHIVAPTGIYKEAYTPKEFLNSPIENLVELWVKEITQSIEQTGSKAGFIKIAVSDDGVSKIEIRNIRAAARASLRTGAAIASHTIGGKAAIHQLALLEEEGLSPEKFVWVHADSEPDLAYLHEVTSRGANIEFDFIGQPGADPIDHVNKIKNLITANKGEKILLSHDAGWYQPGQPGGQPEAGFRGYTFISEVFLPLLLREGLTDQMIKLLTEDNPKKVFGIPVPAPG